MWRMGECLGLGVLGYDEDRPTGVRWSEGARRASSQGVAMADKSPRQHLAKKAGKSLKEKRAEKHLKAESKDKTHIVPPSKH
jgi:hypothetical protein